MFSSKEKVFIASTVAAFSSGIVIAVWLIGQVGIEYNWVVLISAIGLILSVLLFKNSSQSVSEQ